MALLQSLPGFTGAPEEPSLPLWKGSLLGFFSRLIIWNIFIVIVFKTRSPYFLYIWPTQSSESCRWWVWEGSLWGLGIRYVYKSDQCSPWGCKESDTTEWLSNNNKASQHFLSFLKQIFPMASLEVQWLGLQAFIAEGMGSILGWGTKIP